MPAPPLRTHAYGIDTHTACGRVGPPIARTPSTVTCVMCKRAIRRWANFHDGAWIGRRGVRILGDTG